MNASERWKHAVLEADDWTCQACGTVKHLDAAHIEPRSRRPDLATDPANGVTLCRRDHDYFHAHPDEFSDWVARWQKRGRGRMGYWFTEYQPDPLERPARKDSSHKRTSRGAVSVFTDDWILKQNARLE